jgi:hypothetical protein
MIRRYLPEEASLKNAYDGYEISSFLASILFSQGRGCMYSKQAAKK